MRWRKLKREQHGLTGTPEQISYTAMMQRCYNKNHSAYPGYGGRGIVVCERWRLSLVDFLSDMGARPKHCSIGRINNDGNYEPSNCRWETQKQQARNTRKTLRVEHKGNVVTLASLKVPYGAAYYRLKSGWPIENIISGISPQLMPLQKMPERPIDVLGFCKQKREEGLHLRQIGELLGVTRQRVDQILKR